MELSPSFHFIQTEETFWQGVRFQTEMSAKGSWGQGLRTLGSVYVLSKIHMEFSDLVGPFVQCSTFAWPGLNLQGAVYKINIRAHVTSILNEGLSVD